MPNPHMPNLDAMDADELDDFASLFNTLSEYARYKSCAVNARLAGRSDSALAIERTCDLLYEELPPEWRW